MAIVRPRGGTQTGTERVFIEFSVVAKVAVPRKTPFADMRLDTTYLMNPLGMPLDSKCFCSTHHAQQQGAKTCGCKGGGENVYDPQSLLYAAYSGPAMVDLCRIVIYYGAAVGAHEPTFTPVGSR